VAEFPDRILLGRHCCGRQHSVRSYLADPNVLWLAICPIAAGISRTTVIVRNFFDLLGSSDH